MNEQPPARNLGYHPCRYGASKILFRGPPRRLRGDYVTFVGGSDTFGPMIAHPYPDMLEDDLGVSAINLGCRSAGIDLFNSSPALLDICSMSCATVVQVLGAANMSNRFYTVDPRHNERFVRASKTLKSLYPEVEFARFTTTAELLLHLAQIGPERLHKVRYELQTAWVARMRTMLGRIEGPKILLWLADHIPFSTATGGTICRDPLFVDRAMLNAVKNYADCLVEVIARPSEINEGLVQIESEQPTHEVEDRILGLRVHERVRTTLEPVLGEMIGIGRNIFLPAPQLACA